jgi:hypothetical protein
MTVGCFRFVVQDVVKTDKQRAVTLNKTNKFVRLENLNELFIIFFIGSYAKKIGWSFLERCKPFSILIVIMNMDQRMIIKFDFMA